MITGSMITILPPLVAERIAAGEVIERPASVVKELVENSIDAGATQIEVRLVDGGCDLIEVTDNGQGMSQADLELCVCRHATSKIHQLEDLDQLNTLGFRGEALPSIAAVSELIIKSRSKINSNSSADTYEVRAAHTAPKKANAQRIANHHFAGSSHGTCIQVMGLFSQIPARLKFLKSVGSEASAVREMMERLAFTHPEIAFRLYNGDRTVLDLPNETLEKRAERLLAQGNPFELLIVELDGSWAIKVLWLKGLSMPNMRSMVQIVNGRSLKDRILSQAILNPLRQSFLPGHFPAMVVKLDIPCDELDVNVHPTKTEVRFLDSKKIFALCSAAIERMLHDSKPVDFVTGPYLSMPLTYASPAYSAPSYATHTDNTTNNNQLQLNHQSNAPMTSAEEFSFEASPFGQYRGVIFQTYLLFERNHELLMVDQHAAHERIRYEMLKNKVLKRESIESQALLIPEIIHLDSEQLLTVSQKIPLLLQLGFECEVFGESSLLFRSIPAVWGTMELSHRLKNLVTRLEHVGNTTELVWDETLFEKVAMEACRSSVKGGDRMTEHAAIDLAQKLMRCQHPDNCPHGRPTFVKLNELKVEEWFSRKI